MVDKPKPKSKSSSKRKTKGQRAKTTKKLPRKYSDEFKEDKIRAESKAESKDEFSREPFKKDEPVNGGLEGGLAPILVDTREKNPYVFDEETLTVKLDTGDYTLKGYEGLLAVDRKASVSELAHNLIEPRFKAELERLSQIKHSYLLLEFSLEDVVRYPVGSDIPKRRWRFIRIKPSFILSALSKITIKYGVHVILAGNRSNAKNMLDHILKHARQELA